MTTEKTTPPATASANAPTTQDDFEAAFAEITKDEGNDSAKPDAAAAAADTGTGQAAGADSAGSAGSAETATDAAAATAAAAAAATPAAAAADASGAEPDELAKAQARIAELEAAVAKPPKDPAPAAADDNKPAAEAPETPAAEPEIKWYAHSEEEKAVIDNFKKEWPEQDAAMQIVVRAAVYNTIQYTYAQIAKQYGPQLARFGEVADEVESFMALSALRGAHNDYDTIRDKVVEWVDTLPGFQKRAAQSVLDEGTPEEVNELIAEYKKTTPAPVATGTAVAAPAGAPKGKTELSAAAKKAAGKLSVVDSKRTSDTTAAADPNDFDAAWREATAG